jgi:hypothetical protein
VAEKSRERGGIVNAEDRESLWAALRAGGLAEGELPERSEARAPWFVRVMLGIAGWIGAMFLFSFVGALFVYVMKHAFAAIGAGALACAVAAYLFRSDPKGEFSAQFALAVSLAGQVLIGYGLAKGLGNKIWATALVMSVVQGALFVLVPNFVHRVWSAWAGVVLAAVALGELRLYPFVPALATAAFAWVWIREFDFARHGAALRAGGYGLALAAMQAAVMHGDAWTRWLYGRSGGTLLGEAGVWLGAAAAGAVLVWAVVLLLGREGVRLSSSRGGIALAGASILGLASLKAPGIGPAAAILVVGYANGNRVLAGLGIVSLVGYLSHYYYAMHATLLEKSALLAATGLALLAARLAVQRLWPAQANEVTHA